MKRVLLEAPILTQSGYGEHSRLVFRALSQREDIDLYISPLNWGATSWCSNYDSERVEIDNCVKKFQTYIAHAKAQETQVHFDLHLHVGILSEFEPKAPKTISITAGIETDRVSANWLIKTHKGLSKMIVPSEHAKNSFLTTSYQAINESNNTKTMIECSVPIDVVPYPVKKFKDTSALDLNLKTKFNFLSVGLLSPRKNFSSMIKWFVEEFRNDNVGLILKTSQSTGSNLDKVNTRKILKNTLNKVDYFNEKTKCKVYLLHGDLTEEELHSLYSREDIHAYLTTTHGEGYGLPIFEAAYSGLPVVATDWSGHLDFLTAPYKESGKIKQKKLFVNLDYELKEIQKEVVWKNILEEGSRWAYVKKSSFKKKVRSIYKNYGMYKKWSSSLKGHVLEKYSEEKVLKEMSDSIMQVFEDNSSPSEEEVFVL